VTFVIRKCREKLSMRKISIRPKARKAKAKGKYPRSIRLQIRKLIRKNSMTRDKKRYSVLILLSLNT
jgi:hypothetical protein